MSARTLENVPHVYVPGDTGRTLLALHGTGGNEHDLVPLAKIVDPAAGILSPRGRVLENGMPRFFRRLAEGVFDEEDLVYRAEELARFVVAAAAAYRLDPKRIIAVGYSNGANIAAAVLLLHPGVLAGAALLRPMVPIVPKTLPDLGGLPVLIAAGPDDPVVPEENTRRLVSLLRDTGARVTARFENAGHSITEATVDAARRWLGEVVG